MRHTARSPALPPARGREASYRRPRRQGVADPAHSSACCCWMTYAPVGASEEGAGETGAETPTDGMYRAVDSMLGATLVPPNASADATPTRPIRLMRMESSAACGKRRLRGTLFTRLLLKRPPTTCGRQCRVQYLAVRAKRLWEPDMGRVQPVHARLSVFSGQRCAHRNARGHPHRPYAQLRPATPPFPKPAERTITGNKLHIWTYDTTKYRYVKGVSRGDL